MKFSVKSLLGLTLCASLTGVGGLSALSASNADDDAKRYGVRASVLDISLSPSGTKLAWVAPGPGHTEQLLVIDMEENKGITPISSNSAIYADLSSCQWATDDHLVCEVNGMGKGAEGVLFPFTRSFTIRDDGSDVTSLTPRRTTRSLGFNQFAGELLALDIEGEEGRILITRNYVPEEGVGTRLASDKQGLGIDQYNIKNGRRRVEERPDPTADYFLADEKGEVRLKARSAVSLQGYTKGKQTYLVREQGENRWRELNDVTLNGASVEYLPVAIDSSSNQLLAFTSLDGYQALIGISLDGTKSARVIAARDDVDVDGLVRLGRQRRVIGVTYSTEKRSVEYFDPEFASLAKALGKALPNQPLINFAGASADENKLLIVASSDTDPGSVYLFDKTSKNLEVLLAMREGLVNQTMGEMRPITYPAGDGTQIPGYLTLPAGSEGTNLPAIVLPHGGPSARDYWGFDWLVQFFTSKGYAVLQPNFRGSSGYGEAWFGRNGFKAWDLAIGDVNDAGRWLVSEGIADPDKLAIVGWSYGGYAALQSQVVEPELYKAVVAIAPVTDLDYLRQDARAYTNFRSLDRALGEGQHIEAGSPRRHAEKFTAPVMLIHGTLDVNVEVRHSKAMNAALQSAGKPVTYMEFADLQHDLDDSDIRVHMLGSIDQFLNESLAH